MKSKRLEEFYECISLSISVYSSTKNSATKETTAFPFVSVKASPVSVRMKALLNEV